MTGIKFLLILGILLFLALPLLPFGRKGSRFLTYSKPHGKKNAPFILLALAEFLLIFLLFRMIGELSDRILSVPFFARLFAGVGTQVKLDAKIIVQVVLVNAGALYLFVFLKGLLKSVLSHTVYGDDLKKDKKNAPQKGDPVLREGEPEGENEKEADPEGGRMQRRGKKKIPAFPHEGGDEADTTEEDGKPSVAPGAMERSPLYRSLAGLFYEGDNYEYVKPWAACLRSVLTYFMVLVEILYFILIALLLVAVFFPAPGWMASVTLWVVDHLFIYPFIPLLFLREIRNTLVGDCRPEGKKTRKAGETAVPGEKRRPQLQKVRRTLLRRFGRVHRIRYFPRLEQPKAEEYELTNTTFRSGLDFIKASMNKQSGHVVQKYMEGMDGLFNGKNVHFSASFYSELGEYLIAYTYIRLLAGERMVFVTSDAKRAEDLQKYIGRRLMALTGTDDQNTWRVRGPEGRLDQTDILVCTPDAFSDDNMVENNGAFFEEVAGVIFTDAENILTLDSYLCPIMAIRLQKVTEGRVRFIFVTDGILEGVGAAFERFFCLNEHVISISSASENESVSYYLWNRESPRIYDVDGGHRRTSLEGIVAGAAYNAGADGVRILTKGVMDNTETNDLVSHGVEINTFFKTLPDVNYLVVDEDRFNLASALYTYTRFGGKDASVLHILSRPYLLREYFMARIRFYINHASYIQPRAPEHVNDRKISLVRIFCEATAGENMTVPTFNRRVREVIERSNNQYDRPICPWCTATEKFFRESRDIKTLEGEALEREVEKRFADFLAKEAKEKSGGESNIPLGDKMTFVQVMAAYLVAGLIDTEVTPLADSRAHRVMNYYTLTAPPRNTISFINVKDVFDGLLECNRRVELRLNDETLGTLPLFSTRVFQQYLPGQNLVYNNTGYEIERISKNGRVIYLRRQSVTLRTCLDTVPLRRFTVTALPKDRIRGEVSHSLFDGPIKRITLTRRRGALKGETFGFYSLMSDQQTLDFVSGAEGDLNVKQELVEAGARNLGDCHVLDISIACRETCNDRERLLLAAVFNEFVRTIFPDVYACVAVCPVLAEPIRLRDDRENMTYEEHVRTLYPFLTESSYEALAKGRDSGEAVGSEEIRLLLVNDCEEDVGVLDQLYDGNTQYFKQILTNIHGYLYWLQKHKRLPGGQKHYISFGKEEFPEELFDLDGCCELLSRANMVFSEQGKEDRSIVSDPEEEEITDKCAFCHDSLEDGRFFAFDGQRLICTDCAGYSVCEPEEMNKLWEGVRDDVKKRYPKVPLPVDGVTVRPDPVKQLGKGEVFSPSYYRVDVGQKCIYPETDDPAFAVEVSLLRGLITLWQDKEGYGGLYAKGQLLFEELLLLSLKKRKVTAAWIYENVDPSLRGAVDEIAAFVGISPLTPPEGAAVPEKNSFDFMAHKRASRELEEELPPEEDPDDRAMGGGLYDPDATKRFWKRFLRGDSALGSEDELPPAEEDEELPEEEEAPDGDDLIGKEGV